MTNIIHYGRKRSGIKRELTTKIESWLKSIKDQDVRNAARRDVIVTGGSIASMLLGENINDFDLYFRTKETTIKIAQYYVDKFNDKNVIKVADGVNPYVPEVREESIINCKGIEEERVLIWIQSAGIAGEGQEEYSYFEKLPETEAIKFIESVAKNIRKQNKKAKYLPVFMSDNAITLTNKVQLIIRFYGSPDKIHDNYDFVHAKCYWDHSKEELHLPLDALEALLSRTLIYQGSLYPIASIFRMKKFIERGWRITAGQQLKIMWQISELNLKHFPTLREQLIGVDIAYMHQLIQAIKEIKDKELLSSTYVSKIIDRIFD